MRVLLSCLVLLSVALVCRAEEDGGDGDETLGEQHEGGTVVAGPGVGGAS